MDRYRILETKRFFKIQRRMFFIWFTINKYDKKFSNLLDIKYLLECFIKNKNSFTPKVIYEYEVRYDEKITVSER
jgi:hypothetical protein